MKKNKFKIKQFELFQRNIKQIILHIRKFFKIFKINFKK